MFEPFDRREGDGAFLQAAAALADVPKKGRLIDVLGPVSNIIALLNWYLEDINWVGVYLLDGDRLVLGPFQGLPACETIPLGRGVCGTAAARAETVAVGDVHQFPGHIACDGASESEIVAPVFNPQGKLIGVLDVDSPVRGRFSEKHKQFFSAAAGIIGRLF